MTTRHDPEPIGDILPRVMDGIRPDAISTTPGAVETVIALRQALKRLLRSHGLRRTSIEARGWPGIVPLPKNPPVEVK